MERREKGDWIQSKSRSENNLSFLSLHLQWDKRSLGLLHDRAAAGGDYVDIANGKVDLGVATDGSCGFVWDNEGPSKVKSSASPFPFPTQSCPPVH